jgi:aminoglycoside 3-N-acetyltransferase
MTSKQSLIQDLRHQGIRDRVVCLHSSFRSFGTVEGGPAALIGAFLELGNTLLCPSFFYACLALPPGPDWQRNGIDYANPPPLPGIAYEGRPDQIEPSMGVIPRTLLSWSGTIRSEHPLCSFVACGPLAGRLMEDQDPLSVYSCYKNIMRLELPADILLAGTGLTRCTPVHCAEELAGKVLFRRWANWRGQIIQIEDGSCSEGFENLASQVAATETSFRLGGSPVRRFDFGAFVEAAAAAIRLNPTITACGDPQCVRCRNMALGGRLAKQMSID